MAPVSRTRSRGRLPRARSLARACFCSSWTRAFTSFSREVRRLAELVGVVARRHAEQPLDRARVRRVAGQLPHRPADARAGRLDQP